MIRALIWKIKLDLKAASRYKFSFISDIVVMTALLGMFLISDTGKSLAYRYGNENYKSLLLIGYFLWMLSITAISSLSTFLNNEAKIGTISRLLHSSYPIEVIILGEYISSLLIQSAIIFIISLIARLVFSIELYFNLAILVSIIFCTMGMFGMGLIISGISLYVKKVGSLVFIIQMLLLFITDTVPSSNSILKISQFIPLTMANNVSRLSISGLDYTSEMVALALSSFIWLAIGIVIFEIMLKFAKKKGVLLLY